MRNVLTCGRMSALTVLGIVFGLQGAANADPVQVDFYGPASAVKVGEQFSLTVKADVTSELVGFGFDLLVGDPDLIRFDEFQVDSDYTAIQTPDKDNIGALAFPDYIVGNNVPLGIARFTALAPGTVEISGRVTPGDLTEGFAELSGSFSTPAFGTASVTIVNDIPDIPEPSAFVLMALTGMGIIWRLRR
jgi:hypothetical protein